MKKKRRWLASDTFWGLAAAFLVLLQFWWLPGEDGSATDSYSTTVDGRLGLFRTLSNLFPNVERDSLNVVPKRSATLLLIAPDRYPGEQEQQQIYEFVYNGGNLLFAPSWNNPDVSIPMLGISISPGRSIPDVPDMMPLAATGSPAPAEVEPTESPDEPAPQTSIVQEGPLAPGTSPGTGTSNSSEAVEEVPDDASVVEATSELVGKVRIRSNARLSVPVHLSSETLVESTGGAEAAAWMMGSGRVVVCSSPDVFSNRSMLFSESRRLAVRLVEQCSIHSDGNSDIVISEYFNASDSYQSTGVLFSPMLRIGTLQLLLVAVLGIWMAFHRFGPAVDVTTLQRRSLTESAQAVGNLQYRLRDGGAAVRGYLEYMRSQLRRRFGSLLRLDQPEAIASRAGMDPAEVREQLKEAGMMAESSQLSAARAAAMLRWLSHLHQRLSGNRESKNVR